MHHSSEFCYALLAIAQNFFMPFEPSHRILLSAMGHGAESLTGVQNYRTSVKSLQMRRMEFKYLGKFKTDLVFESGV
jgi:hypothetical protein